MFSFSKFIHYKTFMQKMDGLMAITLKNRIHSLHPHWTFAREHLLLKSEAFDDLKTVRERNQSLTDAFFKILRKDFPSCFFKMTLLFR